MTVPTSTRTVRRTRRSFAVALLLLASTAACANEADEPSATNPTSTSVPSETTADDSSGADPTEQTPTSPPETTPPETDPPETLPPQTSPPQTAPPQASAALMPNVICMNLQDAQDRIQEEGVFFSRSYDATGDGRMQIIDSNWVVVEQDPAPGTPIGEGDANLGAVKYGESSRC